MVAEGMGDAEYVKRVQRGHIDTFEILVRRYEKAIFNLAYRLLGDYDEAAEVAQEVFLSAFKSIQQFRGEANFSTWLYRIGLNHASTRRKSLNSAQRRHLPLDGTEVMTGGADPAKNVENKEIQQRVQQTLNPNPTLFRSVSGDEPYRRGQWDSALRATPQSPNGDDSCGQGLRATCTLGCPRLAVSPLSLTAHAA